MVGAVRGIDPQTGHYFDDTKRYVDALDISDEQRHAIFEGNARRVFPRLDAKPKDKADDPPRPESIGAVTANGFAQCEKPERYIHRSSATGAIITRPDSRRRGNLPVLRARGAVMTRGRAASPSPSVTAESDRKVHMRGVIERHIDRLPSARRAHLRMDSSMSDKKERNRHPRLPRRDEDIPGTRVFTLATRAAGLLLNQFAMSLMKEETATGS